MAEGAVGWFHFWDEGFGQCWFQTEGVVRCHGCGQAGLCGESLSLFGKILLLILQVLLLVICLCSSDSGQKTLIFFKINSQRTSA